MALRRWPSRSCYNCGYGACLAVLLGAGLAMSGCVLQTLLHNPLAEPGLIGVSSGASLLAVLALFVSQQLGYQLPAWGSPCRPSWGSGDWSFAAPFPSRSSG